MLIGLQGGNNMTEKRAFTKKQFEESGYDKSGYKLIEEEGEFKATLDFKIWGSNNLLSYFTLEDGRKIFAGTWRFDNWLGLCDIPFGSTVTLIFKKAKTNTIYLKEVIREQNIN